jgi:hypothetical protein
VPNEVLTEEEYRVVMDAKRPIEDRKAAFAARARWIAPLGKTSYTDQINNMIVGFDQRRDRRPDASITNRDVICLLCSSDAVQPPGIGSTPFTRPITRPHHVE